MKTISKITLGILLLGLANYGQAFPGGMGGGGRMSNPYLQGLKNTIDGFSDLSATEKAAYKALLDRSWPKIMQQITDTNVKDLSDKIKNKKDLEDFLKNLPQEADNTPSPRPDKDGNRPPPDGNGGGASGGGSSGGRCGQNGCPPSK